MKIFSISRAHSWQINKLLRNQNRYTQKLFELEDDLYLKQRRSFATPVPDDQERPVKFTTSKAASWNARSSRGDFQDDSPRFQPLIVFSSLTVFMLYFCVFREENDIDHELKKSLFDRIPGLEKKQLEIVLDYNESQGLDTSEIKRRLEEIENEETQNEERN